MEQQNKEIKQSLRTIQQELLEQKVNFAKLMATQKPATKSDQSPQLLKLRDNIIIECNKLFERSGIFFNDPTLKKLTALCDIYSKLKD